MIAKNKKTWENYQNFQNVEENLKQNFFDQV
jgi:hypothetical protein